MNRKGKLNEYVAAIIYLVLIMWWTLLIMVITLNNQFGEIAKMIREGYSVDILGLFILVIYAFLIGLSFMPGIRRLYKLFPWLYSFIIILFSYLITNAVATEIICKGYEVNIHSRHVLSIVIMIIQVIVFRFLICLYLYKRPVKDVGVTDFE